MKSTIKIIGVLVAAGLIGACSQPAEFALPEGDIEQGQALFVSYGCTGCHTVRDLDLPAPGPDAPIRVPLGGGISKLKSYPELVTSVINPSHKLAPRMKTEDVSQDGESLMRVYNDTMTVTELVNIVAFLESRYEKIERPSIRYRRLGE